MRIADGLYLGLFLICFSCSNATHKQVDSKIEKGPLRSNLTDSGTIKMMNLVTKYFGLKNALVESNAPAVAQKSKSLADEANSMTLFLAADSINKPLLQQYLDTIIMQTQVMAAIQDISSCERQRLVFNGISGAMYAMLKRGGLKNGGVYKQYCPMAFNDKGAYWLSEEEEIKNPYFGKKMLECGEVQESF